MISNTQIGTANTTLYSVPPGESHAVVLIVLCNTDDAANKTITLYAVPSGNSAADSNMIINDLVIPAGDTIIYNLEKFILNSGDSIVGIADATGVTVTFSVMPL